MLIRLMIDQVADQPRPHASCSLAQRGLTRVLCKRSTVGGLFEEHIPELPIGTQARYPCSELQLTPLALQFRITQTSYGADY